MSFYRNRVYPHIVTPLGNPKPIQQDFDFEGPPVEQLSDVELLQILARGQGMTETKFLRLARGQFSQDSVPSEI